MLSTFTIIIALTVIQIILFLGHWFLYKTLIHFFELSNYDLELLLKASGFKILKHEVCGINFMDWLLRNSVFLIGRLIRKRSIKDNRSSQLVDSAQKKFDNSLLAKLLSRFRSNLLWFGSQQLVIAQKI